jgi:hypothetical protein
MSSIQLSLAPQAPLVTLHVSPENYPQAEKIFTLMQSKGYEQIFFDPRKNAVHFHYCHETIELFLRIHHVGGEGYLVENMKIKDFSKTDHGLLSPPTSNGTRYEFHTDLVDHFTKEAEESLITFDERFERFMQANISFHQGPQPSPQELEMLRSQFFENGQQFLKNFEPMNRLLSTCSLEDLEKMADAVKVVQKHTDSFFEYDEAATERRVAEAFQELDEDLEERAEAFAEEMCAGMRERANKILRDGGHADLQLEKPPKKPKQEKKPIDIPPRMRRIPIPNAITATRLEGSQDEIVAYNLRKEGMLTPAKLQRMREITREGIALVKEAEKLRLRASERMQLVRERVLGEPKKDTTALLRKLLQGAPGVCFGECHNETDAAEILITQMKNLAKLKVKTLFVEGGLSKEWQPYLDQYHRQKNGPMPKALRELLSAGDARYGQSHSPFSKTALIRAAKQAGIRVVAIESERARHVAEVGEIRGLEEDTFSKLRLSTMNYDSAAIVKEIHEQETAVDPDAKFALLCGGGHLVDRYGVSNLASLLGCPSIGCGKGVKRELRSRLMDISSYDLFFHERPAPTSEQIRKVQREELSTHDKKIEEIQARIVALEARLKMTHKSARSKKEGLRIQLGQLQAKQQRLIEERQAILIRHAEPIVSEKVEQKRAIRLFDAGDEKS